ncbi:DUF2397 family protein [Enterococcus durans]|uniref:DUF2397 family protein n=1 Tax=Enterococcus durans TaxID=53345 RepID=UPI000F77587A|nr:DUF2397 family protein [Enterococcus durans]RSL35447.1 ATPase [Enterococcus durans]
MNDEAMSLFKFLNTTNSKRYRMILHFFYMEHQQTSYLLKKRDIWEYMLKNYPEPYTEDELLTDLKRLWDYGNLNVIEEQAKKRTLEEFNTNDYTYSIESRTVDIVELSEEIEQRMDELVGELNGNKLRDIYTILERMPRLTDQEKIYKNYEDLKRVFQENNDNTVSYFGYLNKEITKGVLQSKEFIDLKINFLLYLKDYVLELEKQRPKIWSTLKNISEETKMNIANTHIKHRKEIASFSPEKINETDLKNQVFDQFNNIKVWFSNNEHSMYSKIYNQAEQMIQIFSNADVQYFNRHRHARETLKKSDIVFRSFYETVDFRENIEEDLKNTIESAVAESGFLDAIISTDANALIENDKLIIPQPFTLGERSNTLSHYLKIEKNLPDELSEIVGDILNSIQINEGDDPSLPIIYPDGTYQLSILKGKSNSQYKAAFIGESSREAERKRKLESLKNELSQLKEHQKICKEEITQLEQKRSLYEEDFEACPNDLKVRESLRLHKRAMDQVAVKSELERMQLDQKEIAAAELQKHRKKLFDLRSLINIDVSEETLTEIKQYSNNYYNILEDIVETIHQLRKLKNRSAEQETDYHYQKELCKDAIEDLGIVTHQLEDKTTTLKKIKEQREFKEVEEMSLRQEKLKKEIRNKEEEKGATDRLLGELESKINNSREKLDLLIKQKEGKLQLKEDWLKLYSSAIQKYSLDAKIDLHSFSKQFGRKIDRNKLMQISAALTKVIRENRDQLLVYNLESELRKVTIRSKNEDDLLEVLYENWDDYNNFESVEVDTQNMRNSPFLLEAMLRKEKEENDQAYQKDQEEMYRQALFGKLGKTTRELVVEGRNWAVKMDKMLQRVYGEKDDLQLELKLVPKPSQAEGVTSTSQLIDIWSNAEEGILREQDQKKVISFFKKGLDDAIVIVKENPGTTDLKEELKRVFDYRQWFFFRLNYKKNAKQKEFKRLTQEAFMKMSGGERAKSLYLPLFIAMRLRFESASENAPYIITLDEAFSGVDEEGRESMMGVAEELEFNYIMNSQEMWPEYPTVSSINTYEFKQGKSDPFVETVKYGWNGRIRSKIVGDEFE